MGIKIQKIHITKPILGKFIDNADIINGMMKYLSINIQDEDLDILDDINDSIDKIIEYYSNKQHEKVS